MGVVILDSKSNQPSKTNQNLAVEDMNIDIAKADSGFVTSTGNYFGPQLIGSNPSLRKVPEGRVHGANLMTMFARNSGYNFSSSKDNVGPSKPEKLFLPHQSWM